MSSRGMLGWGTVASGTNVGTGILEQQRYNGIGNELTRQAMDFTPKYNFPGASALGGLSSMAKLNKGNLVGQAGVDSANQSQIAMDDVNRRLIEMGVNPSAGRYVGSARSMAVDAAANKAAAMNRAGQGVDDANFQRMSGLAGLQMQQNRDRMGWEMQAGNQGLAREQAYLGQVNQEQGRAQQSSQDIAGANALSRGLAFGRTAYGQNRLK